MSEVRLSVDAGVATLTIDAAETRNGLTPEMAEALVGHVDRVRTLDDVGVLVLTGANGTFCSGADTRRWSAQADPASDEAYRNSSRIYATFDAIATCPVPVIAAAEGACVGAGLNLLLAADVRIVAENARLIPGFRRAGIHPGGGFFTLLAAQVGRQAAAALGFLEQELDGSDAVRRGIAWEAVPAGSALARALDLAASAAADPELTRLMTRSMRRELDVACPMPVSAATELERGAQMLTFRRSQRGER